MMLNPLDSFAENLPSQAKECSDMDWEMYRKSWFEVAIHHPVLDREGDGLSVAVPQANSLNEGDSPFYSGTLPYYMHCDDIDGMSGKRERERARGRERQTSWAYCWFILCCFLYVCLCLSVCLSLSVVSDPSSRYVELNPDVQGISNRPEWFYVFYSPDYHPMKAYALEFQWMAATISILHKMVSKVIAFVAIMLSLNVFGFSIFSLFAVKFCAAYINLVRILHL